MKPELSRPLRPRHCLFDQMKLILYRLIVMNLYLKTFNQQENQKRFAIATAKEAYNLLTVGIDHR